MTKDEALKMAIEALDESMPLVFGNGIALEMMKTPLLEVERKVNFHKKAIQACKEALETPECNPHPKAPHGFNRNASHSAGRYVCECEGWQLEWQGLSDDEQGIIFKNQLGHDCSCDPYSFYLAIEQALKEKNNAN